MNNVKTQIPAKSLRKINRLDNDLTELLKVLKDYSEKTLNKKPTEDKWSVLQIMNHLILAEGYGQNYVVKKLSFNPELKKAGFPAVWRTFLMKTYLKYPFKVNAPDAVGTEVLPAESSFWETAKTWKNQREELRLLFENMPAENFDKEIYKHPFAGRLTLDGLLDFHIAHFARHKKQINKILKKSFKND